MTESKDETAVHLLDPQQLTFLSEPGQPLRVTLEGECSYPRVRVVSAFPLTDPDGCVCLLDGAEKEIGVIPSAGELSREQRAIVQSELGKRYYMPVIQRVTALREEFGLSYWEVETDKGPKTFVLRGTQEHVTEIASNRLMIVDIEGNRFEIRDWEELDPKTYGYVVRLL